MAWKNRYNRRLIARSSLDGKSTYRAIARFSAPSASEALPMGRAKSAGDLSPLMAIALAACGGGGGNGGDNNNQSSIVTYDGYVFNGPVSGAKVYVDVDGDGQVSDPDIFIDETGADGSYSGTVDKQYEEMPLVVALDGATNHADPNTPVPYGETKLVWAAPKYSTVISPLTHLIAKGIMSEAEIKTRFDIGTEFSLTQENPYAETAQPTAAKTENAKKVREAGELVGDVLESDPDATTEQLKTKIAEVGDEAPTAMQLVVASDRVEENTLTAKKLADITFTDADGGDNEVTIAASDIFEIRNKTELWLRAGAVLDYEAARRHTITLTGTGGHTEDFTLTVTDVDEPPTDMEVTVTVDTVDEGFQRGIRIAHVVFTDDDENENDDYGFSNHIYFGDNEVTIAGDSIFEIVNRSQLWLKPEIVLDYEKQTSHTVTLIGPNGLTKDVTLNLRDIVEPPISIHSHQFIVNRVPLETFFEQDGDVYQYSRPEGIYVERALATIIFNDEALNGHPPEIDDDRFIDLRPTSDPLIWQLWQKPDIDFDFEAKQKIFDFTLMAGNDPDLTRTFRIVITDSDEQPTDVLLSQDRIELTEGVQAARLLAHVTFEDPDAAEAKFPANRAGIVGNDIFEMRNKNTELWLKEGAVLDYETMQEHVVTIRALPSAVELFFRQVILGEDNPQFPGLPTIKFTLTVLDDPSDNPPPPPEPEPEPIPEIALASHENHPLNKPVYEFAPTGQYYLTGIYGAAFYLGRDGLLYVRDLDLAKKVMKRDQDNALELVYDLNGEKTITRHTLTQRTKQELNHALRDKTALHDFELPEADSNLGTFTLTADYKDNALFTIDAQGRIWWKAIADYEKPLDDGGDNIYELEVTHIKPDGETTTTRLSLTVQDLGLEHIRIDTSKSEHRKITFTPDQLHPDDLPSDRGQHILGLPVWTMPDTGPLTLTWSLDVLRQPTGTVPSGRLINALLEAGRIDKIRSIIERAFAEFEQYINVKFVEVEHGTYVGDIKIEVHNFSSQGSSTVADGVRTLSVGAKLDDGPLYFVVLHEIAHVMGLNHPFDIGLNGWKVNAAYRKVPWTIASYQIDDATRGLQPVDIEVLQLLYGAPGTNFAGIESRLIPLPEDKQPTAFTLTANSMTLDEGTVIAQKMAEIVIEDDGHGTNTWELTQGADRFELIGPALYLKAGVLDYETAQTHTATITLTATGEGEAPAPVTFTLTVTDVEETVTIVSEQFFLNSVPVRTHIVKNGENYVFEAVEGVWEKAFALATITFNAAALNGTTPTLSDSQFIELRSTNDPLVWQLWLKQDSEFDFETAPNLYDITMMVGNNPSLNRNFRIEVTDADERPTDIFLSATEVELAEGKQETAQMLARVTFEDADAPGTNIVPNGANFPEHDIFEMRNGFTELWIKAGAVLDYETMRKHVVTLTALPTADEGFLRGLILGEDNPQFSSLPTIDFTLTVLDDPSDNPPPPPPPVTQNAETVIHENHPLSKAVYEAAGDGAFGLTAGYADNAFFTVDADGRVWWKALADYENPLDGTAGVDRDNIYEIEVAHTASGGVITKTRLAVTVQDIQRELTFATHNDFDPAYQYYYVEQGEDWKQWGVKDLIPEGHDYTHWLLNGVTFYMPKTGPLEITYSIVTATSPETRQVDPAEDGIADKNLDAFRATWQRAFAAYEKIINVKFIEVPDTVESIGMIRIGDGGPSGGITQDVANTGVATISVQVDFSDYSTYVHELGHVLGLGHPFDNTSRNPNPAEKYTLNSIMTYGDHDENAGLTQNDINALQFLYGAPGTDFEGLEQYFDTPPEVY